MASGSCSREKGQPPALPVKQHRGDSLCRSSVDAALGTVGLQHPSHAYNDVFSEATDCHAAQCPIHQRYDHFQHQERFFSDGTPPPVPRKLSRALSLPAPAFSPLPPVSPLHKPPLDFDNPLYMLAPVPSSCVHEETADMEPAPTPRLPLSQLSFDTPDEHLPRLFSGIDDQRAVSQGIQHRQLLFLRSMAQSVEAEVLLQGGAPETDVGSYQPQDFLLCGGAEPRQVGDAVYYRLRSPKFPGRTLSLKVREQTEDARSAHSRHRSSHANVRDVIVRFQPGDGPRNESTAAASSRDPSCRLKMGCTASPPPHRGSTESAIVPSVQSFLLQGHSASVERDLPHATLEDFIHDSGSECLVYDRQVCVLLVQVLTGLQHLYNAGATAAELRPQDILLVWPSRAQGEGASKTQHTGESNRTEWQKAENIGPIQMLWKTHGSPRVVLTPKSSPQSEPQFLLSIKSQIVALIQSCLHRQGPTQSKCLYRGGLVYLVSLLQGESPGPQLADMVAMLQAVLWGPRLPLFNIRSYTATAVHNWLTIKRALLVMKLAEKGLIQDQSALGWEDCMCLQYLAFVDPETIGGATSQLWLNVKME